MELVILLVFVSLLWAISIRWKYWLEYKTRMRQIDAQEALSRIEKEKMELMARRMRAHHRHGQSDLGGAQ